MQNNAAASSDEEEDLNQLQSVEQKLLTHDPTFHDGHTYASITSQKSALIAAFKPQYEDGDVEGKLTPISKLQPAANSIDYHVGATRIHLSTERWRVCETWFAPSMAGVDCAGLGETLQNVLDSFTIPERVRLVKVRC